MASSGAVSREGVLAELTAPGPPFEIVTTETNGLTRTIYAHAPESLREVLPAKPLGPWR